MKLRLIVSLILVITFIMLHGCAANKTGTKFVPESYDLEVMYDENQPQPPVVKPHSIESKNAPSDAIVLFNGEDISQWVDGKGNPARWKVENGYMEVVKGTGSIKTKQGFGSCQLHIEWATPEEVKGTSQGRGNSGVFLMDQYEVQVLDSYNNITYPAGMAASLYGQSPPMVNASRPPGEWQSYDIIFHRPVFKDGKAVKPAVITVFHNGILVHDHFRILGAMAFKKIPEYKAHPDKLPIGLQDHGNPVRYRNIWIRPLLSR
ncbi:DUF1080 domain-containing protein [candidate division KSB1 bacterium]